MADLSRARVLVVEDEWEIADFVVKGLREEGFSVEHAPDGLVGMRQIDTQTWDIILLDWGLPGESGMSLLKRLRNRGLTTPVIFLTARDAVPDRVKGLEAGADDYLCKPFAFEELLARVKVLIRRGSGEERPR
ncbi:MAG: response regulator [Planctomycetes bacterium]|nr:response regulator [Planctomycetota bacterium]